jgi:hypothetical protein
MVRVHVNGGPAPVKAPSGYQIARRAAKLDASHKALLVADIKAGRILAGDVPLGDLTTGQLCKIIGVSAPYARASQWGRRPPSWRKQC